MSERVGARCREAVSRWRPDHDDQGETRPDVFRIPARRNREGGALGAGAAGEKQACPRDQLARRNEDAGSPMPEGLHAAVSLAEFVALVAVLETLREKTGGTFDLVRTPAPGPKDRN